MAAILKGHITDARGRRYNNMVIDFRTDINGPWRQGRVFKQPKAPAVVVEHGSQVATLGWQIVEFAVRRDLPTAG